jgi:hypothetical protein
MLLVLPSCLASPIYSLFSPPPPTSVSRANFTRSPGLFPGFPYLFFIYFFRETNPPPLPAYIISSFTRSPMFPRRCIFGPNLLPAIHLAPLLRAHRLMSEGQPPQAAPRSASVAGVLYARATLAFANG